MPINPSVACLTALFKRAIDFADLRLLLDPAVPIVEARAVEATSWATDSLESELKVPDKGPAGLFKLLARRTIVATVRQ